MSDFKKMLVPEHSKLKLKDIDPDSVLGWNKNDALERLEQNKKRLVDFQYRLYAENRQSLLIVLQAMDAAGKDGVINQVLSVMNPQGCRSQSFKAPTALEAAHDFLWRAHLAVPKTGEIVIFNRSYYEDVLVQRVHNFVPRDVIDARYGYIRDFERLLEASRTKIVKFFLHISPEEQLARFLKRLENPEKNWKISDSDYREREKWDEYMEAFELALSNCSTKSAPWYVIPSNKKWFRNLAVSEILVDILEKLDPKIPEPSVDLDEIRILAERSKK